MEENNVLLTSQQWEKFYRNNHNVIIINPTGWVDKNKLVYSFNTERITEEEFKNRLSKSITRDIQNKKNRKIQ